MDTNAQLYAEIKIISMYPISNKNAQYPSRACNNYSRINKLNPQYFSRSIQNISIPFWYGVYYILL